MVDLYIDYKPKGGAAKTLGPFPTYEHAEDELCKLKPANECDWKYIREESMAEGLRSLLEDY